MSKWKVKEVAAGLYELLKIDSPPMKGVCGYWLPKEATVMVESTAETRRLFVRIRYLVKMQELFVEFYCRKIQQDKHSITLFDPDELLPFEPIPNHLIYEWR